MRPIIIHCDSSDVADFFDYQPEDPEDFGFLKTINPISRAELYYYVKNGVNANIQSILTA
ncbi:MAG TPA: hypothetical protein VGA96_14425 [Fibrella sp.]